MLKMKRLWGVEKLLELMLLLLIFFMLRTDSAAIEHTSRGSIVHGHNASEQRQASDYYAYEYSDEPLDTTNASGRRVSWLLPLESREAPEEQKQEDDEEEVELPDDCLADGDLHDHDVMDSVMYIYFGPNPKGDHEGGASAQIVLAGTAVALFAQVLTGLSAARRAIRAHFKSGGGPVSLHAALTLLHTELALVASSLVFIFTVHGTGDPARCRAAALLLHYFHLSGACWLAANCVRIFLWLTQKETRASLQAIAAVAWALPLLLVPTSLLIHPEGYEYHQYCWLSVHKGMLVSFLLPLAILITATTVLAILGVRGRYKTGPAEDASRLALRLGACLLPSYAITWFLGVLALEQPESVATAVLFAATTTIFNWLVFAISAALFPDCPLVTSMRTPPPAPTLQHADAQPLLPATSNAAFNSWERGWTPSSHPERSASPSPHRAATWRPSDCTDEATAAVEDEAEETSVLLELRLDPISTISA